MRKPWLSKLILALVIVCCIVLNVLSCKKENTKRTTGIIPSAFTASSWSCVLYAGVGVAFGPTFTGSIPSGTTFLWKFGDSTISTDEAPSHTYSLSGTYIVTLMINNDSAHATSNTIKIIPILGSHYTSLMGGTRAWNGTAYGYVIELNNSYSGNITDSQLNIEVIDSGTIQFLNKELQLSSIDTINEKVLIFSNCTSGFLSYYYSLDSIAYTDDWEQDKGYESHSP